MMSELVCHLSGGNMADVWKLVWGEGGGGKCGVVCGYVTEIMVVCVCVVVCRYVTEIMALCVCV
jgi:hypothetical protein